jgi:hypothetical protein
MEEDDTADAVKAIGELGYDESDSAVVADYLRSYAMVEEDLVGAEIAGLSSEIDDEDEEDFGSIDDDGLGEIEDVVEDEDGDGDIDADDLEVEDLDAEPLDDGPALDVEGLDEGPSLDEGPTVTLEISEDAAAELAAAADVAVTGGEDEGLEGLEGLEGFEDEPEDVEEDIEGFESEEDVEEIDLGDGGDDEGVVDLDVEEIVSGEPKEQPAEGQFVTGGEGETEDAASGCFADGDGGETCSCDEETCPECGKKKKEASMRNRVRVAYSEQGSGGHAEGSGSTKAVEDPKALEDGNVDTEGYSAGGTKFQDGSTLGAEETFSAAEVDASSVSGGESSLLGPDESFPEGKPKVPAGSSPIGGEQFTGGDVSTKGTVIATLTPKGILVQTEDGRKFIAKASIKKEQATKELAEKIQSIPFDGDGKKFAKKALAVFRKHASAKPGIEATITPQGVAFKTPEGKAYMARIAIAKPTKSIVSAIASLEWEGDVNKFASSAVNAVKTAGGKCDECGNDDCSCCEDCGKAECICKEASAKPKLTVEATITPQGIAFKTPEGKSFLAKAAIKQPTKELVEAISTIPWEGDAQKFAGAAVQAVKTAAAVAVEAAKPIVEAAITPQGVAFKTAEGKSFLAKIAISQPTQGMVSALEDIPWEGDVKRFAAAAVNAVKTADKDITTTDTSKLEGSKFTNDDKKEPEDQNLTGTAKPTPKEEGVVKIDTAKLEAEKFTNDGPKEPETGKSAATNKVTVQAADKTIPDPKPIADGNLETDGYTANDHNFQDGKTMGAEEAFSAKEPTNTSGGSESLLGPDESLPEGKPTVPVGEPGINTSTKGTVIAGEVEAKVREARLKVASVYVADLLRHGEISENEYEETLDRTAGMSVQAIQHLAISTKKARERAVAQAEATITREAQAQPQPGLGLPVVVSSNQGNESLQDRLTAQFKLTKDLDKLVGPEEQHPGL